ncbi:phosphoribosylaminoimidazolesuccinocarboxamide synthase [Prochlorococcus sp. MIT 1341]|uniref:phosphoribosylaminoimidazolesuccinocarboxamide synthase n=1 Tax=Prochlorococcus sp. MIT 1341 TaxID=3096221 RepID=UPI002A75001B|nr:phosphoribosylaminoimidazolesuccinocarboxamide synthase [Prochlorococcus sp. MIT 1341]
MTPNHGSLLYEGKAKRVFLAEHEQKVFIEFKNSATAFNAVKKAEFEDKGRLNCQISACLFELLETKGIPTHYLGVAGDSWMAARKVEVIPLEVVLRNIAAGSLCKETPIIKGTELSPALLDIYYKDDQLGDPLLTELRLERLGLLTAQQRSEIETIAKNVNNFLKSFFNQIDLILVDFKLEFGIINSGEIVLADEISPDTCRLWDKRISDPKARILDKDRFRQDLDNLLEAYGEVLKRVQGACAKPRNCL